MHPRWAILRHLISTLAGRGDTPILTHRDVAQFIESLAPPAGDDEGFKFGDPRAQTTGVLVCFMPTLEALAAAAGLGCNLVIHHEDLLFPYNFMDPNLHRYLAWPVNSARLTALGAHGITAYRAHGQFDRFCILDEFARSLGLPEPSVSEGYCRVYDIEPTTVRDLALCARRKMGLTHARVSGDLNRVVKRVGLPWGGLGLSVNVSFINGLLAYEPDVLIAGECDEYAFRFTEDAGIPMIETGHSNSENPGLARCARVLQDQFPALKVCYHAVPCPWRLV